MRHQSQTPSPPIQIVTTPGSGNGRALHTATELRDALRARRRRATLDAFSDLDSLRRWAARSDRRFSLLICVSGDGTLDTAALAAMRRSVPMLAVPCGFGNLFGHALGQPRRVDRVLDLLEHGEVVQLDVGVRNGAPFVCHESFGLLADIQRRVEASGDLPRARWQRGIAYYRLALRHVRETALTRLEVAVDGRRVVKDAVVVVVANIGAYGAWLPLTPAASPVDGLLDVFVMRARSRRQILAALLARQLRLPTTEDGTVLCRGRRVSVVGPRGVRDEIGLLPGRLPVIVGAKTARALARDPARGPGAARPVGRQVA